MTDWEALVWMWRVLKIATRQFFCRHDWHLLRDELGRKKGAYCDKCWKSEAW